MDAHTKNIWKSIITRLLSKIGSLENNLLDFSFNTVGLLTLRILFALMKQLGMLNNIMIKAGELLDNLMYFLTNLKEGDFLCCVPCL